jgi:hypothetical protein
LSSGIGTVMEAHVVEIRNRGTTAITEGSRRCDADSARSREGPPKNRRRPVAADLV